LTGVKQNFARKFKHPIDKVTFSFKFLNSSKSNLLKAPENGCYAKGLYLEGASWNSEKLLL
jgi:dynein heavy chain